MTLARLEAENRAESQEILLDRERCYKYDWGTTRPGLQDFKTLRDFFRFYDRIQAENTYEHEFLHWTLGYYD